MTISSPLSPSAPHETFDWRVAPVVLHDAACTNPACGTYQQPELARLQFQTRPSYPVQIRCRECQRVWHSVESWFRQLHPPTSEIAGLFVVVGSLAGLPYLPWSTTLQSAAAVVLGLAILQIVARLFQRGKRLRAYRLFASLTNAAPFFHDHLETEELQQRLTRMPERFDRALHQRLLALLQRLKAQGIPDLRRLRQALHLHRTTAAAALSRKLQRATLSSDERAALQPLLSQLQAVERDPETWTSRPTQARDLVDSLQQALVDWPQATADEARDLMQEIHALHQELRALLDALHDASSSAPEDDAEASTPANNTKD